MSPSLPVIVTVYRFSTNLVFEHFVVVTGLLKRIVVGPTLGN